jgi:DNA-binding response OmpR family regulator
LTSPPGAATEILIVSDDPGLHHQLGAGLEAKGLQVMDCPGPCAAAPCLGLKTRACPLREAADLVVLDIHPDGPSYLDMSGRASLVAFYGSAGSPVVVLMDEADATSDAQLAGATSLSRLAPTKAVLEAIEELTTRAGRPANFWASGSD